MNYVLPLAEIRPAHRRLVGGKGFALAVLSRRGLPVPATVAVTTRAYEQFVAATGLRGRIILELQRKNFQDLRWEELWDASLRLRHLFLTTPLPPDLEAALTEALAPHLPERCVVRSSAPGEDSRRASFAGLHASFVNVAGPAAVLEHIKLVWASLWSDAALLYRRELGLEVRKSAMAVLIQEMVAGEKSGVIFGQNPQDPSQAVIEAVYGLNQGLVDGSVEPDRWLLDRETGRLLAHHPAPKGAVLQPAAEGVRLTSLPPGLARTPPLSPKEVDRIYRLARRCEALFGAPQDVEWTIAGGRLVVLQSRPITTATAGTDSDQRPWYLSLRRSFANLKSLRERVENRLIPEMEAEAARLAAMPVEHLSDAELEAEIIQRGRRYQHWKKVYWDEFIPLAHGIRLFGMVYNDAVKPQDPYEFMNLLGAGGMLSVRRNRALLELAAMIRGRPELAGELRAGTFTHQELNLAWTAFLREYGDLFCTEAGCLEDRQALVTLILELADHPPPAERLVPAQVESLREQFLARFSGPKRAEMAEYLDLGRASYRLRDDDNLHLGKIRNQVLRAVAAYQRRGRATRELPPAVRDVLAALEDKPRQEEASGPWPGFSRLKARQLVGQPAGPGLGRGPARVVREASELFHFKAGDVLVCDAVDPGMTFVVPLAAGIVERRGGMLIHGSIIAREYGIPCVTGVPRATSLIPPGEPVTVDGYLGIVILG
jgi:phosphohistidine swiveling domain-containing protein